MGNYLSKNYLKIAVIPLRWVMSLVGLSKELTIIAKNLMLFIGKEDGTAALLKNMGLRPKDITEDTRDAISKAAGFLRNEKLEAGKRIDSAEALLKELNSDETVPLKIRELVITSALERLTKARESLESGVISVVAGVMKFQPTLDLLIADDAETLKTLKKLGVVEVPPAVREAALNAKNALEDKSLDGKKRATNAADILAETLQPAYFGGKGSPPIQHELKAVLWEIAHALSQQGSKK